MSDERAQLRAERAELEETIVAARARLGAIERRLVLIDQEAAIERDLAALERRYQVPITDLVERARPKVRAESPRGAGLPPGQLTDGAANE